MPAKQYEDMTLVELATEISTTTDKQLLSQLQSLLASKSRAAATATKEEIKAEKEDSKAEKEAVSKTRDALIAARKEMLSKWKEMNLIISGKSMVKHFDKFETSAEAYCEANTQFTIKLQEHITNIKTFKDKQSGS